MAGQQQESDSDGDFLFNNGVTIDQERQSTMASDIDRCLRVISREPMHRFPTAAYNTNDPRGCAHRQTEIRDRFRHD